jgi:hypothetical protein
MSHLTHGYALQTEIQELPPNDPQQAGDPAPEQEPRRIDDPYAEVAH